MALVLSCLHRIHNTTFVATCFGGTFLRSCGLTYRLMVLGDDETHHVDYVYVYWRILTRKDGIVAFESRIASLRVIWGFGWFGHALNF